MPPKVTLPVSTKSDEPLATVPITKPKLPPQPNIHNTIHNSLTQAFTGNKLDRLIPQLKNKVNSKEGFGHYLPAAIGLKNKIAPYLQKHFAQGKTSTHPGLVKDYSEFVRHLLKVAKPTGGKLKFNKQHILSFINSSARNNWSDAKKVQFKNMIMKSHGVADKAPLRGSNVGLDISKIK